jgi:hypothetical protein
VCRVVHVECDQPNFLGLGSAGGTEELVTTVEPWQTILGSIILRETQFRWRCIEDCATDRGRRVVTGVGPWASTDFDLLWLDGVDSNMESSLVSFHSCDLTIHRGYLGADGFHAILHGDYLSFKGQVLKELLDVVESWIPHGCTNLGWIGRA